MNISSFNLLLLTLMSVTIGGCNAVTSSHLLGSRVSEEVAEKFEGVWQLADLEDVTPIFVKSVGDGALSVAGLDWEDGEWTVQSGSVVITQHQDAFFLNLEQRDSEDDDPSYMFFRISGTGDDRGLPDKEGRTLLLFLPDVKVFGEAIERGQLQGEIKKGSGDNPVISILRQLGATSPAEPDDEAPDEQKRPEKITGVHIRGTQEELDEFLKDNNVDRPFDMNAVIVLRRIAWLD